MMQIRLGSERIIVMPELSEEEIRKTTNDYIDFFGRYCNTLRLLQNSVEESPDGDYACFLRYSFTDEGLSGTTTQEHGEHLERIAKTCLEAYANLCKAYNRFSTGMQKYGNYLSLAYPIVQDELARNYDLQIENVEGLENFFRNHGVI